MLRAKKGFIERVATVGCPNAEGAGHYLTRGWARIQRLVMV
jgi:hypothetical protein